MMIMSAGAAKEALSDGKEIALLDVREHGQHGEGHPLFSVNCPFSELEFLVKGLVPNLNTRIVLLDHGDGVSERAFAALAHLGYVDVRILEGGAEAWRAAGFTLFRGESVPSKAYGEMVEHDMGTPSISALELNDMLLAKEDVIVLDGRSPEEFTLMNIPSARSCPNAELGLRIDTLVLDDHTPIVINCAGRTRSIIGAQSLRSLGIKNPVFALRNGSQGWQLAGLKLENGTPAADLPPTVDAAIIEQRRNQFILKHDLPTISRETLMNWMGDSLRTTYLFDVRSAEEFRAGGMSSAVHAPGGQLVQLTDEWVAVRGARVVLADNHDVRAATTCFWLRRMGHDAYILDADARQHANPRLASDSSIHSNLETIQPREFSGTIADEAIVLDASEGRQYRNGHIKGATWAIRPRLSDLQLPDASLVVVVGQNPQRRALVAGDLQVLGHRVLIMNGGLSDWQAAGMTIVETPDVPSNSAMIDFLFFVHDRHSGVLESARRYLEWETGLIAQMDDQEKSVFTRGNPEISVEGAK